MPALLKHLSHSSPLGNFLHWFFVDPERCVLPFLLFFAVIMAGFGALVIKSVPYTEIDWKAYMQQIELIKNGERDYYNIRGVTGPLVYPAGYVYVFSGLHSVVSAWGGVDATSGSAIISAQWIFLAILVANVVVVAYTCIRYLGVPKFYFLFLLLSKRMWSLSLLRLFNDAPAMLIAHLALLAFSHEHLLLGCTMYSLAVSCKMNVLLMAPGLAWYLFRRTGSSIEKTCRWIVYMGFIQLVLGAPFLLHNPKAYIHRSFELSRVFLYKWTVNWRFVSEDLFLSKSWGIGLLFATVVCMILFIKRFDKDVKQDVVEFVRKKNRDSSEAASKLGESVSTSLGEFFFVNLENKDTKNGSTAVEDPKSTVASSSDDNSANGANKNGVKDKNVAKDDLLSKPTLLPAIVVAPGAAGTEAMLTCNFIGIVFSRTIHYQFYLWYVFHLPYLVAASVACCTPLTFCVGEEVFEGEDNKSQESGGNTNKSESGGNTGNTNKALAAGKAETQMQMEMTDQSLNNRAKNNNLSVSSATSGGKNVSRAAQLQQLSEVQAAYDRRYWLAHLVNLGITAACILGIELCYNWPKDSECRNSPQLAQCENPATPVSSFFLLILHLALLFPRVFLGKESYYPVVNTVVRAVIPKSWLLDLGKAKAA